jgi:hypothetical protein
MAPGGMQWITRAISWQFFRGYGSMVYTWFACQQLVQQEEGSASLREFPC